MRNIIIKITLLVLVVLSGKVTAFGQNTDIDIRCEVGGLDLNLSQDDPGYLINFGSFSLFAEGEKSKEEKGAVGIVKYYKLPRTNLILSVLVGYAPTDELSSAPELVKVMFLGKKKAPGSKSSNLEFDKFFDEITKHAVSYVHVGYPMEVFDRGGEGKLLMGFLGKKKPVGIIMRCKKVAK